MLKIGSSVFIRICIPFYQRQYRNLEFLLGVLRNVRKFKIYFVLENCDQKLCIKSFRPKFRISVLAFIEGGIPIRIKKSSNFKTIGGVRYESLKIFF